MSQKDNDWNAPHLDPALAVGYDLAQLTRQPQVKAGDWVTLTSGDRVVLRRLPKERWPPSLHVILNTDDFPELLFFMFQGRYHIGALNGFSLIGMKPAVNTTIERLTHVLKRGLR